MSRGFYRVKLGPEYLQDLGKSIANQSVHLSVSDLVSLVSDSISLAEAGYGSTVGALEFIRSLKDQTEYMYTLFD